MLLCVCASALLGCNGSGALAPIGREPDLKGSSRYHKVRRGETLYAIAWRHGLDYRQLAVLNGIRSPYVIYPGQTLRLRASRSATGVKRTAQRERIQPKSSGAIAPTSRSHQVTPGAASESKVRPQQRRYSNDRVARSSNQRAESIPSSRLQWQWPARGKLVSVFGEAGRKGVDIEGKLGEPVLAASDGRVVYSGDGLLRYGKLIIIKHNGEFLSAYAHNNRLVVDEGESVARGQRIAEMGRSGTNRVMLHFEIRRNGTPVDPMRYLPK